MEEMITLEKTAVHVHGDDSGRVSVATREVLRALVAAGIRTVSSKLPDGRLVSLVVTESPAAPSSIGRYVDDEESLG